jgi:hypothetical protein
VDDDDTVSLVEMGDENADDQTRDESTTTDTTESSKSGQSAERGTRDNSQQKSSVNVDVRVSIDITEMEKSEIEDKLEAVASVIENVE